MQYFFFIWGGGNAFVLAFPGVGSLSEFKKVKRHEGCARVGGNGVISNNKLGRP